MRKHIAFMTGALALAGLASAPLARAEPLTLQAAWQAALQYDPEYRAAIYEREAGLQNAPIGRAGLLPSVNLSTSLSKVGGERTVPSLTGRSEQDLDYTSRNTSLSLRQPLYNREAAARARIGSTQAEQAEARFEITSQQLAVRVAQAYFDVLLARDVIALSEAQLGAYEAQVALARRMFTGGEGTRTEIADAEARASLGRAELLSAQDQLEVALQKLATIIGGPASRLPAPALDWLPPPLEPASLEIWLDMARDNSPVLRTQRYAVEVAVLEVARSRAGHYPRVDFVASLTNSTSDSVTTIDQRVRQHALGVQLQIPLYAGGGVSAQVEQAVNNHLREKSRLDRDTNQVLLEVRQSFLNVTSAWARIEAYRSAVDSAQTLQRGVEIGIKAGTRVQAEALDATRLLYIARRDLALARYQYLLNRLTLEAAAGVLDEGDIRAADLLLRG